MIINQLLFNSFEILILFQITFQLTGDCKKNISGCRKDLANCTMREFAAPPKKKGGLFG